MIVSQSARACLFATGEWRLPTLRAVRSRPVARAKRVFLPTWARGGELRGPAGALRGPQGARHSARCGHGRFRKRICCSCPRGHGSASCPFQEPRREAGARAGACPRGHGRRHSDPREDGARAPARRRARRANPKKSCWRSRRSRGQAFRLRSPRKWSSRRVPTWARKSSLQRSSRKRFGTVGDHATLCSRRLRTKAER